MINRLVINIDRRPRLNNLTVIHNENPVIIARASSWSCVTNTKVIPRRSAIPAAHTAYLYAASNPEQTGAHPAKQPRLINDCPRDGYTLALTARQFANRTALKAFQLNHFQYFSNPLLNFFYQPCANAVERLHFQNSHMRKQCIGLKNRVDVSFIGGNIIDADAIKKNISVCRV